MGRQRIPKAMRKDDATSQTDAPALAAIGLEAEFGLIVDGVPVTVEEIFRDPRDFLGSSLIHRTGTSYHLPTEGAVRDIAGVGRRP